MMRLFYDRYYTRMTHYNGFNQVLHGMNTGYETQYLDFAFRPSGGSYYWATVAQESHYKHVRVWRHQDQTNAAIEAGFSNGVRNLDWSGRIVHNDDIHGLTLDPVTDNIYLMTFYNENDRILNISTFNFGAFVYNQIDAIHDTNDVGSALGSNGHYNQDIAGPAFTELYLNGTFSHFLNFNFLVSCHTVFETSGFTAVVFAPTNSGNVRIRWFEKTGGSATATAPTNFFTVNTDMKRIEHVDCTDSGSNNAIHCVFVGPDRLFFHYEFNYGAGTDIASVKKYTYRMYKDYKADDILIGSSYIVMKAHSLDDNDKTVLTYRRMDLTSRPGHGFLWGSFRGTEYADVEWQKVQVQMSDWQNGNKIYVQTREDVGADVYDIANLRVNVVDGNWQRGETNCIHFDRSVNSKCVPIGDIWYRVVPNHPGPAEKQESDRSGLLEILGWILAGLVLAGLVVLLVAYLTASPKPGYAKGAQAQYYENTSA